MSSRNGLALATGLAALAWMLVAAIAVRSVPYSLSICGLCLLALALLGWVAEIRKEDGAATAAASAWPLLTAGGIGAAAAGLLLTSPAFGLTVAVPLALALTLVWLGRAMESMGPARPAAGSSLPVGNATLLAHAADGDAIAIEAPRSRRVARRDLLRGMVWLGLGSGIASALGMVFDFLFERHPTAFGGVVTAGTVDLYPPGSKTKIQEGHFWLVNLSVEQGGPGFLALWQKCPHLGCAVPWDPSYTYTDRDTGESHRGWFHCPCHGSTYSDAGVRVYGPAPRSMDLMALSIDPQTSRISVDTGRITKGSPENAAHAVVAPSARAASRPDVA